MSTPLPGDVASEFDTLAEEYVERLRRGEAPDLDVYCAEHPSLATKIRRLFPLLSVMEGVRGSTVSSRATDASTEADARVLPEDAPLPERIGRYRVLRSLGRGGMGRVYQALADDSKDEKCEHVAIKVIHPHLVAKPGYVERFLREADAGRRVEHPNLVRTLGTGSIPQAGVETPYLVLEYVEGQTLRSLLREVGEVPERLCRHIGARIADALAAIHAEGIVHRDVKPENVLITTDEIVKVMDLGIALVQDEALRLSHAGDFVGSLLYAAPEQLDGRTPDGRADLYALGRLLFELMSGRIPSRREGNETDAGKNCASPFFLAVLQKLLVPRRANRFARADSLRDILRSGEHGSWWRKQSREQRLAPVARQALGFERPTRFHGRDAELAALTKALRGTRNGTGRVVLVEGEAGVGKSRLLFEWAERCDRTDPDVRFVVIRHGPGAGTGELVSLGPALAAEFGDEEVDAYITRALGADGGLADALRRALRAGRGLDAKITRNPDALSTAWLRLLRAMAADALLVLIFEDLHFGGEDAQGLFLDLAGGFRKHPVLIVGSTRPSKDTALRSGLDAHEHATVLRLGRLGPTHCSALVREAWGGAEPPEAEPLLVRRSDGNPFFLLELVRTARNQVDARGDPASGGVAPTGIPSSVQSLLQIQLSGLTEEDRELVQAGACVGFEFDPVLVADVTEIPHVAALKQFGRLERRRGLLAAAGDRYRFRHHLVQETLYEEMHPSLRHAYHAAIGGTLLERVTARGASAEDVEGEEAVRLWHHLFQGKQATAAEPFLQKALAHYTLQGKFSRVHEISKSALLEPGLLQGVARISVQLDLGYGLRYQGRYEEAEEHLEAALEQADALRAYPYTFSLRTTLGFVARVLDKSERASTLYREAIDLAREAGDGGLTLTAQSYLASQLIDDHRVDEAHAMLMECLHAAADTPDAVAEEEIHRSLGQVLTLRGDLVAAREHLERAADLARETGFRTSQVSILGDLGALAFRRGDFREAQVRDKEAMELSLELGLRHNAVGEQTRTAHCQLERGQLEDSLASAQTALELAEQRGLSGELASANMHVARVQVERGHWQEALLAIERVRSTLPAGARQLRHLASRVEAPALTWTGRFEDAERLLTEVLGEVRALGAVQIEAQLTADLGRLREQEGSLEEAEALLQAAYDMRARGGSLHGMIPFDLGRVLVRRGAFEDGRAHLEAARDWAHDGGADGLEALARIHLALLPDGDPLAARLLLEQHAAHIPRHQQVEAHFVLWEATREPDALQAAEGHLRYLVEHAPEDCRKTMLASVDLFRRVQDAWRASGAGAES